MSGVVRQPAAAVAAAPVSAPAAREPDLIACLCEWLRRGKPLAEWCRLAGMPSSSEVYRLLDESESAAARVAQARDEGYDAIAQEALRLIDLQPEDQVEAAWRRAQADVRLRLLACWHPQRYGRGSGSEVSTVQVQVITQVPRA